jgi:YVTN family beta-propeller protein
VALAIMAAQRRLVPPANRVTATITVGKIPKGVAAAQGAVWVANSGDGRVSRIDPVTNRVTATITVGRSPVGVVAAQGAVWVANSGDGRVSRIG